MANKNQKSWNINLLHSKMVIAGNSFCIQVFVQVFSHLRAWPPTLSDPDPFKAHSSTWVKRTENVFQFSGGAMRCVTDTPCSVHAQVTSSSS